MTPAYVLLHAPRWCACGISPKAHGGRCLTTHEREAMAAELGVPPRTLVALEASVAEWRKRRAEGRAVSDKSSPPSEGSEP